MSLKTVRGITWVLILGGLLVRSALFALADEPLNLFLALYLVGPYVALALAFHWLGRERRPAVTLLTGTVLTVLITVFSVLAALSTTGYAVVAIALLIPAAQLVCVAVTIVVALLIKVFARPAVAATAAAS